MKKKFILISCIILAIILLFSIFAYYWNYLNKPIKDDYLNHVIEQEIGTELTRNNMLKITELDMSNKNIYNVEWVKYFVNLTYLNLSNNNITNINPLDGLDIKYLDLSYNKIKEVPLIELKSIIILDLSNNRIKDIVNLSNFVTLEDLILSNNRIDSISTFNLPNITSLDISLNNLTSIECIEKSIYLKKLFIGGNDITNINPIAKLDSLEELDVSENKNIEKPIPIAFLNKLKKFDTVNSNISYIFNN